MKDIFVLLNGSRGLGVVEALVAEGHHVAAMIVPEKMTSCDPIGLRLGVAIWRVADVNAPAFIADLAGRSPALIVIAGFSTIVKAPFLAIPRLGAINLHAGRLPQYRGGSPLNWQMINGEATAGLSVLFVGEGIDDGPVLREATIPIAATDTIADLHEKANRLFPKMVLRAIADIEAGAPRPKPQDEAAAAYWHQRSDADGAIDWRAWPAARVERFVRALTRPYPGAQCRRGGDIVRVFAVASPPLPLRGTPGRVCFIQGQGPYVVCADQAVLLTDYSVASPLRHGDILS